MKAVAIGELAVDWLSLERGKSMSNATTFYRYIGGNATNVALGLAKLGLESAIISKIGTDLHADYLLSSLHDAGVDSSWVVQDASMPTAQCYMTCDHDGAPNYQAWPSPNASKMISPDDIAEESFDHSWLWHAAAVSFIAKPRRFAMTYALEQAHCRNKIISFDACFPLVESEGGKQAAWQAMKLADILKFNLAELCYWSGLGKSASLDEKAAAILSQLSPLVLIVTLAENGAQLYTSNGSVFCPPYPVTSIGDVGPGDAFSAGLIYGLSTLGDQGMQRSEIQKLGLQDWLELARYGACTGALVTRAHSATEKFPDLFELSTAMGITSPRS